MARPSVAVCVVARNEERFIGRTVADLVPLVGDGSVARLVVVDGGSVDDTVALARDGGAEVLHAPDLHPELGPVLGKGDSMWRAASALHEDVVVFLDADVGGDLAGVALALAGPLVEPHGEAGAHPDPVFVKGHFRRAAPGEVRKGDAPAKTTGGRVTELVARPLISLHAPDLNRYREPLGGQVAVRRDVLAGLPVVTGYGVEIAMLFDVVERHGHERITQVDLGVLLNPPQPDAALERVAEEVVITFFERLHRLRGVSTSPELVTRLAERALVERPPLAPT